MAFSTPNSSPVGLVKVTTWFATNTSLCSTVSEVHASIHDPVLRVDSRVFKEYLLDGHGKSTLTLD